MQTSKKKNIPKCRREKDEREEEGGHGDECVNVTLCSQTKGIRTCIVPIRLSYLSNEKTKNRMNGIQFHARSPVPLGEPPILMYGERERLPGRD